MSFALTATGLLSSVTNFFASRRISMMLFNNANRGASGKDATNKVTNPNWITEKKKKRNSIAVVSIYWTQCNITSVPSPQILSRILISAGRLNLIFCVRNGLPDCCSICASKGQLPLLQKAKQSHWKDGEGPKPILPRARLAQERSEGGGLQQQQC